MEEADDGRSSSEGVSTEIVICAELKCEARGAIDLQLLLRRYEYLLAKGPQSTHPIRFLGSSNCRCRFPDPVSPSQLNCRQNVACDTNVGRVLFG
jgi:hypothetical protein